MATPRKATLTLTKGKADVTLASSSVTTNTVEVHYDSENTELDIVLALQKCIEVILEQEI
jgi:hypothetical protein